MPDGVVRCPRDCGYGNMWPNAPDGSRAECGLRSQSTTIIQLETLYVNLKAGFYYSKSILTGMSSCGKVMVGCRLSDNRLSD
jgi:hypothetical protein